ncbi:MULTISPECIES: hypothetical protein [unclassified Streptomyces]|uniref:hypothetical protein n=1 Tax=unclassified Streptomyces TaxID=2593676 RepID=UPI0004C09E53|nr:hypothetical protein [Streptomyces sp. NRRL S-241]
MPIHFTVDGFLDERGNLRVWCCFCIDWHAHAAVGLRPADHVSLTPHCFAPDSPYLQSTGLTAVVSPVPWSEVRETVTQATRSQHRAIAQGVLSADTAHLRRQTVTVPTAHL